MAKAKTAVKKIHAIMDVYLDPINSFIPGGCPILNFSVEADDTDPALKQKLKNTIERSQARIIATIEQGVKDGELSPAINAADFAMQLFASLEGGIIMSRISGKAKYMHGLIRLLKTELKRYEIK